MSNIFDAFNNEREALDALLLVRHEYNALAPDWEHAPEWAQWFCIEPGGMYGAGFTRWWAHEPVLNGKEWTPTIVLEGGYSATCFAGSIELPLGIDWRLCKWQRL